MTRFFRFLSLFLLINLLVWFFFPWGFAYGNGAVAALDWLGFNSVFDSNFIATYSLILTAAYAGIYIGMFFFLNSARYALLVISIVGGLASPLLGLSVQSGYEGMLGYFQTIGDGMLIAISFFTDVAKRFSREQRNKNG